MGKVNGGKGENCSRVKDRTGMLAVEEDDMEKYIQKICIALILKNRLQSTCSASMMLEKVIMLGLIGKLCGKC